MIEALARHWGLMNAMSRKAGVDLGHKYFEGALSRRDLRGAVFSCTRCESVPACETFLGGEGEPVEIPAYCRNKRLIESLVATPH